VAFKHFIHGALYKNHQSSMSTTESRMPVHTLR